MENEGLRGSLKQTSDAASRWEAQVLRGSTSFYYYKLWTFLT